MYEFCKRLQKIHFKYHEIIYCFITKHVLDCNRANIISCAPKQFDDPTKGYPVPFQDCCENENVALCTEGCHDQSVTDMFQSFCPYIPPHC
ncbi:hypothetical protein RCL_jg15187.t1 [Rhizophagus clarus]|uniref:Uncharacterized protein n=1 Tax=Rhizophagus clarus TaxID=94130 RepID=A0A8H3QIZ3_9GLOM|nr:hypothetical protein RCL_jg15187.t1 [Rhizophagus clarus]